MQVGGLKKELRRIGNLDRYVFGNPGLEAIVKALELNPRINFINFQDNGHGHARFFGSSRSIAGRNRERTGAREVGRASTSA